MPRSFHGSRCGLPLALLLASWSAVASAKAQGEDAVGLDWRRDVLVAEGLARAATAGVDRQAAAADLAAENAALSLRRTLYGLPVTPEATLSTLVVSCPALEPLLAKALSQATRSSPRRIPPDLLAIRLSLPLSYVRAVVAAVQLGRPVTGRAQPGASPAARRPREVVVTPPAGTSLTPGLMPLMSSRDGSLTATLRAQVARLLLDGATVRHPTAPPAPPAAGSADARLTFRADTVGGFGRACLFLGDADAQRLLAALEGCERGAELTLCLPTEGSPAGPAGSGEAR